MRRCPVSSSPPSPAMPMSVSRSTENWLPKSMCWKFPPKGLRSAAVRPPESRWGLQSLSQVLIGRANEQPGSETLRLPGLRIADKPRFAYRGAMLDCCRHFFTVEEVKSFIDLMFLHKLNTFHWHLTDDQGWADRDP